MSPELRSTVRNIDAETDIAISLGETNGYIKVIALIDTVRTKLNADPRIEGLAKVFALDTLKAVVEGILELQQGDDT